MSAQTAFSLDIVEDNLDSTLLAKLYALNVHATKSIQFGWFSAIRGHSQNINIADLIGDNFSVTQGTDSNGLVGVGYYVDGQKMKPFNVSYGVNAFYLAKTNVNGLVTQEQLFTNLSYHYSTINYPIFLQPKHF
ncbi:MAG: hypothetical protein NXI01_08365 [Gammaproteobacteria bacterium]|nr:hypothetical protein [Gammaproteobacteria bacterium]